MSTCDEKGGVLLELIIFVLVLVVTAAGSARVHRSLGSRFHAIVDARNSHLRSARGSAETRTP